MSEFDSYLLEKADGCPVYRGEVPEKARFCPKCGNNIWKAENEVPIRHAWFSLLYVLSLVTLILISERFYPIMDIRTLVLTDLGLAVFTLTFVIADAKSLATLFTFHNLRWKTMLSVVVVSTIAGLLISAILWEVQKESVEVYYFILLSESPSALWLTILSLGFVPAIFEELGFRGFLQGRLEKFLNPVSAMLVCGSVFAIVHLNAISLIWLVPLGLYTSWLRMRYKLIWYSMVAHLVYNSTIAFYTYYTQYQEYRFLELFN